MNVFLIFLCFTIVTGSAIREDTRPPSIFKRNIGGRIIGGDLARVSQFPFAAAIYSTYATGSFFCSGTVVSNQWILTAAQCISGALQFNIRMGSNALNEADPNRVTVATSTYTLHPEYNPDTLEHDIGLIRLRLPIEFNAYVSAINLPDIAVGASAVVTAIGWGHDSDQSSGLLDNLHFVEIATITNEECRVVYGNQVTEDMVCAAGNFNQGICTGDSGGPLIEYRSPGVAVHVATAIFVSTQGCDNIDPSGFTRTYPYVDWIRSVAQIT